MNAVAAAGSWRNEDSRYVRVAGAWRRVVGMALHVAGGWRSVPGYVPALTASAPPQASGSSYSRKPVTQMVTAYANVSATGGQAPLTYQWIRLGGDARISAQSSNMANTGFVAYLRDEEVFATFSWTVTDAAGQSVAGTTEIDLSASSGFA